MPRAIETGTDHLLAQVEDGVAELTLNRPERRNALSGPMLAGLAKALDACASDPEVRVVVLTGAGGAFCAGGDLKGMDAEHTGATAQPRAGFDDRVAAQQASQRATVARIYRLPKPVIAALPGAAAGAGLGLCLACDLRIAADNAVMVTAFARAGFSGDYGLPWLLTRLVGRAKALELFYLSERLDAERCLALGLCNWVVPAAELPARTRELAERLGRGPLLAYRYMKENINTAFDLPLETFMDGEVMRHVSTGRTEDHREAARAFVEKREPVFKGR